MRKLMSLASALVASLAYSSAFATGGAAKDPTPEAAATTLQQSTPTLGTWGIIAMCLALVVIAARFLIVRRRSA